MKLEIYTEKETLPIEPVRLKLEKCREGDVRLCAVNSYGEVIFGGKILLIKSNGTIERYPGLVGRLGFQLDAEQNNRVKIIS